MLAPRIALPLMGGLALLCVPRSGLASTALATSDAGAVPDRAATADALIGQALALLKQRDYAAARGHLQRAHKLLAPGDPRFHDALLLLGISAYRLGQLDQAELELQSAAESADPETRAQARLFLGQVLSDAGATDQAQRELSQATGSLSLRDSAERLLQKRRPHRLYLTLLVAPELDGNVPLTPLYVDVPPLPAWQRDSQASLDGDLLSLFSIGLRPLRSGLLLGNTISYRQQFRLSEYNLLLNSTWVQFHHLTAVHRLRLQATLNVAVLGGGFLFVDGAGRVQYRRRLQKKWGLSGTYEAHYRDYHKVDFAALSGLSQSLQAELSYGLSPQPVSFGLGYQGLREQTQTPGDVSDQDFRAWAHGPLAWLRASLHSRLELSLSSTLLHRVFDSSRVDFALWSDVNLLLSVNPWLSSYLAGSLLYNSSSDPFFHYVKPSASLGFVAYLGLL